MDNVAVLAGEIRGSGSWALAKCLTRYDSAGSPGLHIHRLGRHDWQVLDYRGPHALRSLHQSLEHAIGHIEHVPALGADLDNWHFGTSSGRAALICGGYAITHVPACPRPWRLGTPRVERFDTLLEAVQAARGMRPV